MAQILTPLKAPSIEAFTPFYFQCMPATARVSFLSVVIYTYVLSDKTRKEKVAIAESLSRIVQVVF